MFRARLPAARAVLPGYYRADVYLFNKGRNVALVSTTLPIGKTGLERRLADYAEYQPLPYGLAAVSWRCPGLARVFGIPQRAS